MFVALPFDAVTGLLNCNTFLGLIFSVVIMLGDFVGNGGGVGASYCV
jgi:hypothetical protein